LTDVGYRGVKLLEVLLNDGEEFRTVRREIHMPSRAIEQPKSDSALEFLDQHAQTRRRDEECLRGAREIVVLCDEPESTQLLGGEFHY
jgi:hypothetical protein